MYFFFDLSGKRNVKKYRNLLYVCDIGTNLISLQFHLYSLWRAPAEVNREKNTHQHLHCIWFYNQSEFGFAELENYSEITDRTFYVINGLRLGLWKYSYINFSKRWLNLNRYEYNQTNFDKYQSEGWNSLLRFSVHSRNHLSSLHLGHSW